MNKLGFVILFFIIIACTSCATVEEAQRIEVKALKAKNKGEHNVAGQYYFEAAEVYEKIGDSTKSVKLYGKAAIECKKTAQEYKNKGNHGIAGDCYSRASRAYEKVGNNAKAMKAHSKAAMEFEQQAQEEKNKGNHITVGAYYSLAARSYGKLGNNVKARQLYLDASNEYEQSEYPYVAEKMRTNAAKFSFQEPSYEETYGS